MVSLRGFLYSGMNHMSWCHGWQRTTISGMNHMSWCHGWQRTTISGMNHHDFSSGQIISTFILVSNVVVLWGQRATIPGITVRFYD